MAGRNPTTCGEGSLMLSALPANPGSVACLIVSFGMAFALVGGFIR
jgi:hypothetical protein